MSQQRIFTCSQGSLVINILFDHSQRGLHPYVMSHDLPRAGQGRSSPMMLRFQCCQEQQRPAASSFFFCFSVLHSWCSKGRLPRGPMGKSIAAVSLISFLSFCVVCVCWGAGIYLTMCLSALLIPKWNSFIILTISRGIAEKHLRLEKFLFPFFLKLWEPQSPRANLPGPLEGDLSCHESYSGTICYC